jgi:acyl-CoA synthetase (NDP forming)
MMPSPQDKLISQLNSLFDPRSIAIVGLPRGLKAGKLFLLALLDQGYPGRIYPVNPKAEEIDGLKSYPSLSAVPDPVDLAIILTPHHIALPVIRECAEKGVKGIVLFTAGYKETGTDEGNSREKEIVRIAQSTGMRIIGPNGMGLYSPKTGISFFPQLSKEPGTVGIISHSGSLTNILGFVAPKKGICFSKVVSLGNECDLNSADFLEYLGNDTDTKLIGAYIEGIKDGSRFFNALRNASLKKPVVIWKVGLTPEGRQAALSHTGAMTGAVDIWKGIAKQGGAVQVRGAEEWIDMLMTFSLLPGDPGNRVAIISGPGGLAVSAAEACGKEKLKLATLLPETHRILADFVPDTGTSLKNPVDVGLTASLDMDIYIKAARTVAADPNVDIITMIGVGFSDETNQKYTDAIIGARKEFNKPFLIVNVPGLNSEFANTFCNAGIPFFESVERAMSSYAKMVNYYRWLQNR